MKEIKWRWKGKRIGEGMYLSRIQITEKRKIREIYEGQSQ